MNEMGKRIRQKRLEYGLTMEELGEKLGVKPSAVNKWEKGIVENIKRSTIESMANIFECSPAWIMGWDSESEMNEYTKTANDNLFINTYQLLGYDVFQIADICSQIDKKSVSSLLDQAKYMYFSTLGKQYQIPSEEELDKRFMV